MDRVVIWRGLDEWRADGAHVQLEAGRLSAQGTQFGADPYRLDYRLLAGPDFVTQTLELSLLRNGSLKRMLLARDPEGRWTADARPLPELDGALDCDLGRCPLTNTMPVLRAGLLAPGAQPHDFVMAWVAGPDLTVQRAEQRYEPIDRHHVRYVDATFEAVLELDDDGVVVHYPELAERVSSTP